MRLGERRGTSLRARRARASLGAQRSLRACRFLSVAFARPTVVPSRLCPSRPAALPATGTPAA